MKRLKIRQTVLAVASLLGVMALAGCGGGERPTPAPPPPPPAVVVIPPQPLPPGGSSPNLTVPAVDAFGVRHTVNTGLSVAQTTWNLRSAYNVAALNCLDPKHEQIVVNYRAFLRAQAKKLTAVNKTVDQEFKARYGARFIQPRETYMTQVYNFFALPPTLSAFCDAALTMSTEGATVRPDELDSFSARHLTIIDHIFEQFFRSYDQYRVDLAGWQSRYMAGSSVQLAPQPMALLPPASTQTQAR